MVNWNLTGQLMVQPMQVQLHQQLQLALQMVQLNGFALLLMWTMKQVEKLLSSLHLMMALPGLN